MIIYVPSISISTHMSCCIFLFVARKIMCQVVNGLLYLHSHGILHRDLTLANLLLTKDMNVVSFGLSFHFVYVIRITYL